MQEGAFLFFLEVFVPGLWLKTRLREVRDLGYAVFFNF